MTLNNRLVLSFVYQSLLYLKFTSGSRTGNTGVQAHVLGPIRAWVNRARTLNLEVIHGYHVIRHNLFHVSLMGCLWRVKSSTFDLTLLPLTDPLAVNLLDRSPALLIAGCRQSYTSLIVLRRVERLKQQLVGQIVVMHLLKLIYLYIGQLLAELNAPCISSMDAHGIGGINKLLVAC